MKKHTLSLIVNLFVLLTTFGQAPNLINYQAVIRNSSGSILPNQSISLRLSIRLGTISGSIYYQEIHTVTTNDFGLVNVKIGEGTPVIWTMPQVSFSLPFDYFLETEIDVNGGSSYTLSGVTQLVSVPFALHSNYAETAGDSKGHFVGNYYGGGIVIWSNPEGSHGIIMAQTDQSSSSTWYDASNVVSINSNFDAVSNKFTDWRLPTKYELELMYANRNIVASTAYDFVLGLYWSSTEQSTNNAKAVSFSNGLTSDALKGQLIRVRAVRTF